ncbi:MAG: hypothetical protein ACOVK2_02860 [Candidatus Fonsibacter sp.]
MEKFREDRMCVYCGTPFLTNQKKSIFCSKSCTTTYRYFIKIGDLDKLQKRIEKNNKLKACQCCLVEKPLYKFFTYKKTVFSFCIECHEKRYKDKYLDKLNELKNVNLSIYPEVDDFVNKIKRNNFMATILDIFILVDLFDKVSPQSNIPYDNNPDKSFNTMFYKLCKWYVKERKKIYIKL